ncbi:MAG TPA: tetratricopeptide repeat protein [Xanthomonadales bacterium]|nr:tetratricopeptide repeat protein [Xanthomonadales bacterium]
MADDQKQRGLIAELRRRNVFKVAVAYLLMSWVLLQIADVLFPALTLPDWTIRLVAGLLILGFPPVLFFAWAFEITPEGLKRDTGAPRASASATRKKLNFAVIALLLLAIVVFALTNQMRPQEVPDPMARPSPDVAPVEKSIAVLPFLNMSDDPANEHFSDGMSEELLNLLAKIPDLKVIGRGSSFQFKGKNKDLRDVGQQLGVANILDGSVRKSGDMVRVTAQLISASDGSSIWSESFNRSLDDIFAVQDEIAHSVVDALKITLLNGVVAERTPPNSSEAYDLYLRGNYLSSQLGESRLDQAREYYNQAVTLDPELAPAWLGLGAVTINEILSDVRSREEGLPDAMAMLERALELDPNLSDAYYMVGFINMAFNWDFSAAETAFRRALEIEPNSAPALSGMGLLMIALNRPEEAIEYQQRSLEIDPLRPTSHHNLGYVAYHGHQFMLSEESFRTALELSGDYPRGHYYIGVALFAQGRADEACAEFGVDSSQVYRLAGLALCNTVNGMAEQADAALAELMDQHADEAAFLVAEALAKRDRNDEAFEWLQRSVTQREPNAILIHSSPFLTVLQSDPRYHRLYKAIGF